MESSSPWTGRRRVDVLSGPKRHPVQDVAALSALGGTANRAALALLHLRQSEHLSQTDRKALSNLDRALSSVFKPDGTTRVPVQSVAPLSASVSAIMGDRSRYHEVLANDWPVNAALLKEVLEGSRERESINQLLSYCRRISTECLGAAGALLRPVTVGNRWSTAV